MKWVKNYKKSRNCLIMLSLEDRQEVKCSLMSLQALKGVSCWSKVTMELLKLCHRFRIQIISSTNLRLSPKLPNLNQFQLREQVPGRILPRKITRAVLLLEEFEAWKSRERIISERKREQICQEKDRDQSRTNLMDL